MAKETYNVLIIGAGGIGSYLLPLFLKAFNGKAVVIDADKLEERNLDRQAFLPSFVGMNKATALIASQTIGSSRCEAVESWFTVNTFVPKTVDVILACPDNHRARLAALCAADRSGIPAVIGGNGYFESMAYLYLPCFKDSKADPRVRYPEILTSTAGDPTEHCTGEAVIEATPQLALANHRAAEQMLHLLFVLRSIASEKPGSENLPIELSTTLYKNEYLTLRDC